MKRPAQAGSGFEARAPFHTERHKMQQAIEMTLPISGKNATIRRPTGHDMVEADRLAGPNAGQLTLQMALLSRVSSIDGNRLPFEDFQELDLEDITAMMQRDFSPSPPPSPPETQQQPSSL